MKKYVVYDWYNKSDVVTCDTLSAAKDVVVDNAMTSTCPSYCIFPVDVVAPSSYYILATDKNEITRQYVWCSGRGNRGLFVLDNSVMMIYYDLKKYNYRSVLSVITRLRKRFPQFDIKWREIGED